VTSSFLEIYTERIIDILSIVESRNTVSTFVHFAANLIVLTYKNGSASIIFNCNGPDNPE
jgi:hypothetical protein